MFLNFKNTGFSSLIPSFKFCIICPCVYQIRILPISLRNSLTNLSISQVHIWYSWAFFLVNFNSLVSLVRMFRSPLSIAKEYMSSHESWFSTLYLTYYSNTLDFENYYKDVLYFNRSIKSEKSVTEDSEIVFCVILFSRISNSVILNMPSEQPRDNVTLWVSIS